MSCVRFAAMILASTLIMFVLTYLNTYELNHVFFSQTRAWMALLKGGHGCRHAWFHVGHVSEQVPQLDYWDRLLLGGSSPYMVRSQKTVDDVSYMRAMIPHRSIAIMTSERAHIKDFRVLKLANDIVEAQVREIGAMETLIADIARHPIAKDQPDLADLPVGQRFELGSRCDKDEPRSFMHRCTARNFKQLIRYCSSNIVQIVMQYGWRLPTSAIGRHHRCWPRIDRDLNGHTVISVY